MNQAFQALWAFMFMLLLFVLVLATAKSNHVIVFEGKPFDVAVLLLTAVTLVVTCLGVFVAILALWGYKEIRDKAIDQAVGIAVERAATVAKEVAGSVAARTAIEYEKARDGGAELSDQAIAEIVQAVSEDQS